MVRVLIDRLHALERKRYIYAVGLAADTKPTEDVITGSVFVEVDTGKTYKYDEEGGAWIESAGASAGDGRLTPSEGSQLASGTTTLDAVGIPEYVKDITKYSDYGITQSGWYVFAKLDAPEGITVSAETAIEGADGYIAQAGEAYVQVAIRFEVAAMAKPVTVTWGAGTSETYIFRATDLAVRNLDYMARFYVYDISEYCTWTYALTTDTAFAADKKYYTEADGVYTLAEVTATEAVPAYYKDEYNLTTDETFQDGVTYYTLADGVYIVATVTVGETVTADTYYVQSKVRATGAFESGVTYYTLVESAYVEATVTAGEHIPAYYNHSKLTMAGMTPNVTYKLDEILDCALEIALPEINDDGHGAWFEIQMNYSGTWSCTLLPPTGVKIGTAQTQAQSAGINTIDLQYTDVNDIKMWTLLNTHSNIPT